jgi:hypothetical protein
MMKKDVSQTPLFVVGNPRSGTSLMRLLMTCHSQVLIPPECGFIVWLRDRFSDWSIFDSKDASRRALFIQEVIASRKFDTWAVDPVLLDNIIDAEGPATYSELCFSVYLAYGKKMDKSFSIWGDKNNYYLNHLFDLNELFPGGKFLHVVRDGRDIACSYREVMAEESQSPYRPQLGTDIAQIAVEWSSNVGRIMQFMSGINATRTMTVRYEDLVTFPERELTRICRWLGIGFESGMLTFYLENERRELEPRETLDWKRRTLEPIGPGTVGRYKDRLTIAEQEEFESRAADVLRVFGYDQVA